MRICTYEGSGEIPFATPEYVYEEGARCYSLPGGRIEPDYGDPIFLENLARFLEEAGRRYNGDPRLELIDVGTFGTWGEGHTGCGSDIVYPADVIKKHIDLTVKNFPDTFVMLNDDHINHRWSRGFEENADLIEYAENRGLGLDDDSVCVAYYCQTMGYNTLRTPWLFDRFYPNAPIVLEFEHYTNVAPENFKGGYPFIDAMQRTGATFAGFHGYPAPWLEREPYLTEYAANRLGYWYLPDSVTVGDLTVGAPNRVVLAMENRGFAKAYRRYDLKLKLSGDGGRYVETVDADNRLWEAKKITESRLLFTPKDLPAGEYALSLGLFEGERPIELGMKDKDAEGFYPMCRVRAD